MVLQQQEAMIILYKIPRSMTQKKANTRLFGDSSIRIKGKHFDNALISQDGSVTTNRHQFCCGLLSILSCFVQKVSILLLSVILVSSRTISTVPNGFCAIAAGGWASIVQSPLQLKASSEILTIVNTTVLVTLKTVMLTYMLFLLKPIKNVLLFK